jgi:antirestriction protein
MTIKQKFSSIDQSKLTGDQKAFLDKIKNVTKNFTDTEMNKKVEAPLNAFIEKAKEKMPEAIKSAPVKRTAKAKPSQTKKPKRTPMSLAKEIRKEGESWSDARARASKMMKEDSKDLSKTVETELDKLSKLVRSQKERKKLTGLSGTDIRRDASRKAKPRGVRRVTNSGETTNQYGTYSNKLGRKYTENRDNRTDRLAPKYPKNAPLLNDGGYLTDPNFGNFQNQVLATGGSVTNERLHVNHNEDYEVRYAKPRPTRKGYKGNRRFELGGTVVTDLSGHTGGGDAGLNAGMPLDGFSNTSYTGLVGETGAMSSAELFMNGGGVGENEFEVATFSSEESVAEVVEGGLTYKEALKLATKLWQSGKEYGVEIINSNPNVMKPIVWIKSKRKMELGGGLPSGAEQSYIITEALGNPAQHFARGGGVRQVGNREYSYGRNWTNDHRHVNKGEDHEVKYTRKGKFLGVFNDGGGVLPNEYVRVVRIADGNYKVELKRHSMDFGRFFNDYFVDKEKAEKFAKKISENNKVNYIGVNTAPYDFVKKSKMADGGSVTNERKHVNHDEDYEVRYAKPRPTRKGYKGARKFMAGGMNNETPRIYVADLEAYNNGRLVGEWLDLADYNDADELMEAIQDVLKKSGGEEYAIHDAEYIPRSMYSEYMGQRDFEELYEMMELAKDNDLPLEVVQEIVSQYDSSAINEFQGKYDSADDFAQQLVDDLGGIQNFNNFERYLTISETDRRLLAQEMADSYVDDIRDEDGGNRLISEAGMDVDEYEGADEDTQEEMLNNAREIVYDEYYDTWYDGLNDPYYFLVEEQGMYSAEDFANANFVQVDYEDLGDALEDDYTYIFYDSDLYVFNIR